MLGGSFISSLTTMVDRPVTYENVPMASKACRDRLVRTPTVIAMAGLPARGKTYISRKLARYLHWIGIKTKGISNHITT
jgi:signal recognition particle GTPase